MTSLRSRTRVCRHTVACGRLTGGMGPGAIPGASHYSPPLLSLVVGFCCGAPPGAPAFCFPAVCGACFLGGAPGGLAGVSGGCSAFFLTWCAIWNCRTMRLLALPVHCAAL